MSDELYSKVTRRMWIDEVFCAWSKPSPNAQSLWQYLLTGLHNGRIPGLFRLSVATMADDLGWDVDATQACFGEILRSNRAKYDPITKLVWLPGALHHNKPTSTNQITGWAADWRLLPSCPLLREAAACFRALLAAIAPSYASTFDGFSTDRPSSRGAASVVSNEIRKPSATDPGSRLERDPETVGDEIRKPFGTQEQDQDQEQKSDRVCGADLEPDTKRARVSDPQPQHPRQDIGSIGTAEVLTREHLSLLLTRYLVLRPLLAPEHIEHLYVTAFDHKLRFGHAREAISMWHATRAPACKHASAEALLADLGRYFAKAHEHAGRSAVEDPDIEPALSMFDELWCKKHKLQSRCRDEGDERRMAHVLKQAKAHTLRVGAQDWRMVLGPVIAAYLVLEDRWLAENSYPVSGLSKRLSRLLEHKPRKPKPAPKPAPPPQPTPAERAAMAREAQAEFERLTKARAAAALAPAPPRTPLAPPSAPVDPSGSAQPQDAPFPCQESASPICEPDRASRDGPVPIGQVVDLMPRLRGMR